VNWLDLVLGVTLLVSVVSGLKDGFVKTCIGFFASILGLVMGLQYYRQVGVSLRPYIHTVSHANLAGFLIIFFGISILGAVAAVILRRFVREIHLGGVDRIAGGAFGVVRGILFATVTIWVLLAFVPASNLLVSGSRLAPGVMSAARRVADSSPDDVKESFRRSYRELNKVVPDKMRSRMEAVPPGTI
jgi:membrane protein required for colicin V production